MEDAFSLPVVAGSADVASPSARRTPAPRAYTRPPRPIHFPESEEVPETNIHLELRTALYLICKRALAARATIGSDQFVYYVPTTAKKRLAPDVFVRVGTPHAPFRIWKTWLRGAPDLAVEIVSASDESDEAWEVKYERYRASGIREVVRFDADDAKAPLRVWDHVDGDLVERVTPENGVFECAVLGLHWVVVEHEVLGPMLRLSRDPEGKDLLLTYEEAEAIEAKARAEEAKKRESAERDRDRLAAEVEKLRRELQGRAKPARKARTKKR